MENVGTLIGIFFWILVAGYLIWFIVHLVIEPVYILLFRRPLYLYWNPILSKLSASQLQILEQLSFYKNLSSRHRRIFEDRVSEFISYYKFYGKEGLAISDEIKVMVAASYVMLSFGMRQYKTDVFDKIIVYPNSYHSTINNVQHNGEFNPQLKAIVFSWKHFKQGYQDGNDNLNLGIHEFAHVLHYHGIHRGDLSARIFADRYNRIMKEVKHPPNAKKLIDSDYFRIYAYTNQYEFLAVILEHFFETPQLFKTEFPQLYKNVKLMINYRE